MTHRVLLLFCLVFSLGTAGCSDFPELEDTIGQADRDARFPSLMDLEGLLNQLPTDTIETANVDPSGRIAALNNRAARLRGPVLTRTERQRLTGGVAVPAAIR